MHVDLFSPFRVVTALSIFDSLEDACLGSKTTWKYAEAGGYKAHPTARSRRTLVIVTERNEMPGAVALLGVQARYGSSELELQQYAASECSYRFISSSSR